MNNIELLSKMWDDSSWELTGINADYQQPIDRDQAIDDEGNAIYESYVLSKDVSDEDSPVPEYETHEFSAEDMEAFSKER